MMSPRFLFLVALAISALTSVSRAQEESTNPQPLSTPAPAYPEALTDTGREGTAVITFTVTADGSVRDATVKSADDPAFGTAALEALKKWTFKAAVRDGQPVAVKVSQPFRFSAPVDQKVNAIFQRKVFREVPEQPIAASAYRGSLVPLNQPPISYPSSRAGSGEEHTVEVAFVIGPDGRPLNPTVMGEVPPDFAASAIMHIAALVFEYPLHNGKPAYVEVVRKIHLAE